MFENTLLESFAGSTPALSRRRRAISIVAATSFEIAALGALVLVPLIRTEALDLNRQWNQTRIVPPSPQGVWAKPTKPARANVIISDPAQEGPIIAPDRIPPTIPNVQEGTRLQVGPDVALTLGESGNPGAPDGIGGGIPIDPLRYSPPPEIHERKTKPAERQRISSGVQAANLIHAPKPEYPPFAKLTRTQGAVRLEAFIDTDGRIQDLQVLSGHPMLVKAALDAVAQWRYRPTLLNGDPVEVQTEIVVNFTLGD